MSSLERRKEKRKVKEHDLSHDDQFGLIGR